MISNAALFIPAFTAFRFRRIFRCPVLFTEAIVSALYHLCDYSSTCLFGFQTLHYLDFFFAELLIVSSTLYLIDFGDQLWVEWLLFFISIVGIVVLQITLPAELYVQAGIVAVMVLIVAVYWFIWGVPRYRWDYFTLGISLISGSVMLFTIQGIWPEAYWATHSLWHAAGALGMHYLFYIKEPARLIQNAASAIPTPIVTLRKTPSRSRLRF